MINPNRNYGPIIVGSDSPQNQNVVLPDSFIVVTFLFSRRELKAGQEDTSFPMSHRRSLTESGI